MSSNTEKDWEKRGTGNLILTNWYVECKHPIPYSPKLWKQISMIGKFLHE